MSNLIESSIFSLQNLDNYYDNLKQNSNIIFLKYIEIVNIYCKLFYESINIQKKSYYKYLFKSGLETICHVFNNILLYTNNLELTFYYCQKAYLYFVEFICQIDNTNHSFLQLNGKDASLFVYKKTIFEINNEKRKSFEGKNNIKINNTKLLTKIYNDIILLLIEFDHVNLSHVDEKVRIVIERLFNLYNVTCSRENSPLKRNHSEINLKNIEKIVSVESLESLENIENINITSTTENLIIKPKPKRYSKEYNSKLPKDSSIVITLHETTFNYKLKIISEFLDNIYLFYQIDDINILFAIENNLLLYIETLCAKIKKYDIKKFTDTKLIINKTLFSKISDLTPNKFINSIILE